MDSDKILVMSAGSVEEFDHPYRLLTNKEGLLYNLVQTTGKTTALNLENVAREVNMTIDFFLELTLAFAELHEENKDEHFVTSLSTAVIV
ncbi:hypothetical protein GEV33_000229 [Tenebrio molitor]|uniref:Uncharacterized protein n=1 Tax=Tenebrio molitor TaxID=7067 RepID=A0A8J6LL31_TENMO|nr:hypothetical protein GEV33_000229 [Tenebrio molitor]